MYLEKAISQELANMLSPILVCLKCAVQVIMNYDLFYLTYQCVYQIQEKHLGTNKLLYMAAVDLKKAIDRVLRDVI